MQDLLKKPKLRNLLILILSCIPLLIHLYVNLFSGYGYFRDELYFIACSNRPDIGYVDHPPLSILILYLNRLLAGDSVFALRFLPAVNSALTVFITILITMKLGGKAFAVILSAVAVIFAPVYLAMNSYYSMNSFDILFWSLAFYLIVRIIAENKTIWWILLGIVFGLGLLNKISFLWLETGFFIGLLITEKRKELMTFKPYMTTLISLIIFSPFIIWNFYNDFAHIEFIKNAVSQKYSNINVTDFLSEQFLLMNPFSVILAMAGLYYLFFNPDGKKYNILGVIFISVFAILIFNSHSKAEYLSPAYTSLFAAGSVFIQKKTYVRIRWIRYAFLILISTAGILSAPFAMPLLPVNAFIEYSEMTGIKTPNPENKELSKLPQFFADMQGWEEMAENVSNVYMTLPKEERLRTIVYCGNYGEAAAMEFYKNKFPIPRTISGHNSYWLWGYPEISDPLFIIIGGNKENLLELFENVEEKLVHNSEYSMPYENNLPVFIARNPKSNLPEIWEKVKHYE